MFLAVCLLLAGEAENGGDEAENLAQPTLPELWAQAREAVDFFTVGLLAGGGAQEEAKGRARTTPTELWALAREAVYDGRVDKLRADPAYCPVSALFYSLFPSVQAVKCKGLSCMTGWFNYRMARPGHCLCQLSFSTTM